MRLTRSLVSLGAVALVAASGLIVAPVAQAAAASPTVVTVDCTAGTGGTTVTGAVGDTFTITNTGVDMCDLMAGMTYVSGSSAIGPTGGPGSSETYTILGAGSFSITGGFLTPLIPLTISISDGGGTDAGGGTGWTPGVGEPRPQDVPNVAGAVTATAGGRSASVQWMSPTKPGNQAVTLYEVSSAPDDKRCVVSAPATSCTVADLHPGTTYTFTVKSFNGTGWGPASAPSNAVTIPMPPSAPTNVRAWMMEMDPLTRVLTMKWDPSPVVSGGGSSLTYFTEVASCPNVECDVATIPESDWWMVQDMVSGDTDLTTVPNPDNRYAVRVRARDEFKQASDWAYGVEIPGPFTGEAAVQLLLGTRSAQLSWTLPEGLQSKFVRNFEVTVRPALLRSLIPLASEDQFGYVKTVAGSDTSTTIDLPNGTMLGSFLQFAVKVNLIDGTSLTRQLSPWRQVTNIVPDPTGVKAQFNRETGRLFVQWNLPKNTDRGAMNIIGHRLHWCVSATSCSYSELSKPDVAYAVAPIPAGVERVWSVGAMAVAWPGKNVSAIVLANPQP